MGGGLRPPGASSVCRRIGREKVSVLTSAWVNCQRSPFRQTDYKGFMPSFYAPLDLMVCLVYARLPVGRTCRRDFHRSGASTKSRAREAKQTDRVGKLYDVERDHQWPDLLHVRLRGHGQKFSLPKDIEAFFYLVRATALGIRERAICQGFRYGPQTVGKPSALFLARRYACHRQLIRAERARDDLESKKELAVFARGRHRCRNTRPRQ